MAHLRSIQLATAICLLCGLPMLFKASGVEFWKGAISYEPPFKMFTNSEPNAAGIAADDWMFYTMGSDTNGVAEVTFHLESLQKHLGSDKPARAVRTLTDLKQFVSSKLREESQGQFYSVGAFNLGGREAIVCTSTTNRVPPGPSQWHCGIVFFWNQNPDWEKSTICAIAVTSQKLKTLGLLTNSLRTISIESAKFKK